MSDDGKDWIRVARLDEIKAGGRIVCEVAGLSVLLCRTGGDWVAVRNHCTHLGKPLAEGRIMGGRIFCPHHSACFDLRSGEALSGPAVGRLSCYPVRVDADDIWVRVGGDAVPERLS